MSDDLRKIYEAAGKLAYYFDTKTPVALYRGQTKQEAKAGNKVLYPNPGFTRKNGSIRLPDLETFEKPAASTTSGTPSATETWVKGCRTLHGDYRGVSTFDRTTSLPGMTWYLLPKDTDIPVALAVTKDGDDTSRPIHYTIAPKDDMTLSLFLVWLDAFNDKLSKA